MKRDGGSGSQQVDLVRNSFFGLIPERRVFRAIGPGLSLRLKPTNERQLQAALFEFPAVVSLLIND
mgnify:CR=1 FL=1